MRRVALLAAVLALCFPAAVKAENCMSSSTLASWSVRRRAARLVVAPVEESEPLAAERLVAEGIGGLLLFGSSAPTALPVDLDDDSRAGPWFSEVFEAAGSEVGGALKTSPTEGGLDGRRPRPAAHRS